MSDTELLREAARRIRETADAATPGPWTNLDRGDRLIHLREDDEFDYVVDEPMSHEGNADHIALWHPGTAHLVADLLESEAAHHDGDPSFGRGAVPLCDTWPHAVAIARALSAKEA